MDMNGFCLCLTVGVIFKIGAGAHCFEVEGFLLKNWLCVFDVCYNEMQYFVEVL